MAPQSFSDLIFLFLELIAEALPVVAGLAFLVFVYGLVKFIFRVGGDEKAVTDGKALIKWGLIALFIMVSFMGILSFFHDEFGFNRIFFIPLLPQ